MAYCEVNGSRSRESICTQLVAQLCPYTMRMLTIHPVHAHLLQADADEMWVNDYDQRLQKTMAANLSGQLSLQTDPATVEAIGAEMLAKAQVVRPDGLR